MAERNMIQVSIEDGSFISVIPADGEPGSYGGWRAHFFGIQDMNLEESDCSQISLEALRKMSEERDYQERVFLLHCTDGTWYEVCVLPDWKPEKYLLMVRDIHHQFRSWAKRRRIELYEMVRRKLTFFREQGATCGIVVIELRSGRHCFKDQHSKNFFSQSMYQGVKGDLNNRIRRLSFGGEEYCPVEGVHTATDCLSMVTDSGTDCWVSLFGYAMTMEPGRRYMYLIWVCVPMMSGALRMVKVKAGIDHKLTKLVESYLFEWNIGDNQITLVDNWDEEFSAVGDGKNGFRKIERYAFKDDIPRVCKLFNLILSGDIGDNAMVRFYIRDGEMEKVEWCSISLISVLYDGSIPMYVMGAVRDLNSKLKMMMGTIMNSHGVTKEITGRAKLLTGHVIRESLPEYRHVLMAVRMDSLTKGDGNIEMEIVIYQYMELVTRMICPDDIVWMDEENLMLFLRDVGNGLNARKKAKQTCRVLESSKSGEATMDNQIATYPDDGENSDTLMKMLRSDTSLSDTNVIQTLNVADVRDGEGELYHPVNFIPDILDEWYRTIGTNNLLTKEMKLIKAQLILSQIKPHFIYGVLANIKSLIYADADKAADIVVVFTEYLRIQLSTLGEDELAQFPESLDFVKSYTEIEKSRFPGKIHVEYGIRYEDFRLPHFVLQPIAENAIKHGIYKRETPGNLVINSRLQDNIILVEIIDNGVGFDTRHKSAAGGEHGAGLENVRIGLRHLVRGELQIESRNGTGTRVTVRIPK